MDDKTAFDENKDDRKDFLDPAVSTPIAIIILQTMLTTIVSFFTWESCKQVFRWMGWKKDDDDEGKPKFNTKTDVDSH